MPAGQNASKLPGGERTVNGPVNPRIRSRAGGSLWFVAPGRAKAGLACRCPESYARWGWQCDYHHRRPLPLRGRSPNLTAVHRKPYVCLTTHETFLALVQGGGAHRSHCFLHKNTARCRKYCSREPYATSPSAETAANRGATRMLKPGCIVGRERPGVVTPRMLSFHAVAVSPSRRQP